MLVAVAEAPGASRMPFPLTARVGFKIAQFWFAAAFFPTTSIGAPLVLTFDISVESHTYYQGYVKDLDFQPFHTTLTILQNIDVATRNQQSGPNWEEGLVRLTSPSIRSQLLDAFPWPSSGPAIEPKIGVTELQYFHGWTPSGTTETSSFVISQHDQLNVALDGTVDPDSWDPISQSFNPMNPGFPVLWNYTMSLYGPLPAPFDALLLSPSDISALLDEFKANKVQFRYWEGTRAIGSISAGEYFEGRATLVSISESISEVPEPSTISLVLIAGISMLTRLLRGKEQ